MKLYLYETRNNYIMGPDITVSVNALWTDKHLNGEKIQNGHCHAKRRNLTESIII